MGEANLRYARGDTELAAQICMEIIRQVYFFKIIKILLLNDNK